MYTASTLAEAGRIPTERAFDISDQSMTEIEGTAFLRAVAAASPEIFRILITGKDMVGQVLNEASSRVIQLFVTRPWEESFMRPALECAAATSELRRKTWITPRGRNCADGSEQNRTGSSSQSRRPSPV